MKMAIAKETIKVEGMSCKHCKMAVEKAALGVAGVESAEVNLESGTLSVVYDPGRASREKIVAAVNGAGYKAI